MKSVLLDLHKTTAHGCSTLYPAFIDVTKSGFHFKLFLEKHRNMLNQVLRQSGGSLTDGPFAVLTQMPKLLDFDVKRIYFRKQMQKIDERARFASFNIISFHLA